MNDLDRLRTEAEARRRIGETRRTARYSDAVNRYLGAVNYRELNLMPADIPVRQTHVAPGPAKPRTRRTKGVVGGCGRFSRQLHRR